MVIIRTKVYGTIKIDTVMGVCVWEVAPTLQPLVDSWKKEYEEGFVAGHYVNDEIASMEFILQEVGGVVLENVQPTRPKHLSGTVDT